MRTYPLDLTDPGSPFHSAFTIDPALAADCTPLSVSPKTFPIGCEAVGGGESELGASAGCERDTETGMRDAGGNVIHENGEHCILCFPFKALTFCSSSTRK